MYWQTLRVYNWRKLLCVKYARHMKIVVRMKRSCSRMRRPAMKVGRYINKYRRKLLAY